MMGIENGNEEKKGESKEETVTFSIRMPKWLRDAMKQKEETDKDLNWSKEIREFIENRIGLTDMSKNLDKLINEIIENNNIPGMWVIYWYRNNLDWEDKRLVDKHVFAMFGDNVNDLKQAQEIRKRFEDIGIKNRSVLLKDINKSVDEFIDDIFKKEKVIETISSIIRKSIQNDEELMLFSKAISCMLHDLSPNWKGGIWIDAATIEDMFKILFGKDRVDEMEHKLIKAGILIDLGEYKSRSNNRYRYYAISDMACNVIKELNSYLKDVDEKYIDDIVQNDSIMKKILLFVGAKNDSDNKKIIVPSTERTLESEEELKNYLGVSAEEEYYPALRKLILNNIITWDKNYDGGKITIMVCGEIEDMFKVWWIAHRDELSEG